jgi:hypothetical protein
MIIGSGLPKFLWAKAIHHSVWLGTRLPTRALPDGLTPLEKAGLPKPILKGVLEWGVTVWVKRLTARKLDPHTTEGHFIGYNEEAKGHHIYWLKKRTVTIEHDMYVDKDAVTSPGDVVFEGEWPVPTQALQSIANPTTNEPIKDKHDDTLQSMPAPIQNR